MYSIACASKPDGTIDPETVMVRARHKDHLQNLQKTFPVLAELKILSLPDRDYRYRIIVPKAIWIGVLSEMADEQTWSNFKNEATRYQGKRGADYVAALHDVWDIMF